MLTAKESAETKLSLHIQQSIKQHPDKAAYTINAKTTTYSEMETMALHIASAISSALQNTPRPTERPSRIGISLPKESHYVPCILATMLLRCSYVPIDIETPDERKRFIIADSQLDFLIDSSNLDALLLHPVSDSLPDLTSLALSEAYMIYTSGTTGTPKGVSIPYSALYSFMQTVCLPDQFNISSNSRILQFASINFDVSVLEVFSSLYYGATLIIPTEDQRHDATRLYQLMRDEEVTYAFMPPSLLSIFPSFDLPAMDTMAAGGEAVPHSVTEKIVGKYPFRLVNGYGPTESTVITTTHEFRDADDWRCIGKPLPGIVCYVADKEGKLVQPGEKGELLIGGAQLSNCYWNRPELNEKAYFPNPYEDETGLAPRLYHSGDLVELNEDGSFNYLGRIDSQVKLHSYRIELNEITTLIEAHPRVRRAYTRLEELGNDKYLVVYISTEDGNADFSDIREHLAQHVPQYMIPTFWNHVPSFELNINGKIDKTKLVNEAWRACHYNTRKPNENEQIFINAACRILGCKDVNIDSDLIDEIGLTSLQIMQLPQDVEACGLQITVEDIYHHRTIRRIIENHLYRLCFWYNDPEEHPERPVLIYVCGHPYYGYFEDMLKLIEDKYNIFIIESFHTILCFESCTTPILTELYKLIVRPIVEKYNVVAYLGYCLGGEQALFMAHDMYNDAERKPHVVVIDGEVLRDKNPDHYIPLSWPVLSDEQNHQRWIIDTTLIQTSPDENVYNGPVAVFLSELFDEQQTITPEEMADIPVENVERYRARIDLVPKLWRETYPHAHIEMFDGSHFTCMHKPSCLKAVADYVNGLV